MDKLLSAAKSRLAEKLEITKNILTDEPVVEFYGRSNLRIENHKGIIMYSSDKIIVKTSMGIITVAGKNLTISSIVTEEMIISGSVDSVAYKDPY